MKHHPDIQMEIIIADNVREMVESATPPSLEESWARFEKKLSEQHPVINKPNEINRKKLFTIRLAVVAGVIILMVGTLTVSFPTKARALGERMLNIVGTLFSGTQVNIGTEYKYNEPDQPSPPNVGFKEVEIGQEITVSLDEARSTCPYPLAFPGYLPPGSRLDIIKYQEMVKPLVRVTMSFNGPDSSYFVLTQVNSNGDYAHGYGYDIEDTVMQDFQAGENTGKLYLIKNNKVRAIWNKQGIIYTIEGSFSKEDIIKIIESM